MLLPGPLAARGVWTRRPAGTEWRMSANGNADARAAGLRYSSDEEPGISRRKAGRGFSYRTERGGIVSSDRQLARIRALGIPPAWTGVWICADARGHLQATGRDVRGRKQYLYHADWRALRDETKFERMLDFGTTLPRTRERIETDLALSGLQRERVLAAVVRLVDETLIRVGNESYRRQNGSIGATTMRERHVHVEGRNITVEFKGKSGKLHQAELADRRLARTIQKLHDLPGRELFEYLDDGERRPVRSDDVNAYLQEVSGAGDHGQGLPHLGRERALHAGAERPRSPGLADGGQARDRGGDPRRRHGARQHTGRVPRVLRAPRNPRELRGRGAPERLAAPPAWARPLRVGPAQVPARAFMTPRRRRGRSSTEDRRAASTSGSTTGPPRRASRAARARP